MTGIQANAPLPSLVHCQQAPQVLETHNYIKHCPDTQHTSKSEAELHPFLEQTAIGTALGSLAGAGTALAVSQFLDEPLPILHRQGVGGFQGLVSAASGSMAAQMAASPGQGAVYGGIAGGLAGGLQGWLNKGTLTATISGGVTGLTAGASGGYVSVKIRNQSSD